MLGTVWQTVAPVFGLILLGYVAGRTGYIGATVARAVPEFIFKIAMPVLLFRMVANARAPDVAPLDLLACFFGAVLATWLVATLMTAVVLRRPGGDGPAVAMGSTFSNTVMMGLPICLEYFGPQAGTILALIITFDTVMLWLLAILHLALVERSRTVSLGTQIAGVLQRLMTNPIVLAALLGLAWGQSGLVIPATPDRMMSMLAGAAVPGALVAMGLTLATYEIRSELSALSLIAVLKLLVMPAVAWALCVHVFHLPALATGVIVTATAMPVGANAFLFASAYDKAPAAVSGAIAVSTPLSMLTIAALLYAFGVGLL